MSEMKKWNTILFWIQFIIPIPLIAYGYLISWIPAEIIYSIEHGSWKDDFLLILAGGVACYICGLIKNVSAQYNYEQYLSLTERPCIHGFYKYLHRNNQN